MRGGCPACRRGRPVRRGRVSGHCQEGVDLRRGEHAAQMLQLPAVMCTEEGEGGGIIIYARASWKLEKWECLRG